MKAMTLRLSDEQHERLRREAFEQRVSMTDIILNAITHEFQAWDRPLTIRSNPAMPSDEELLRIESETVIGHWEGDAMAMANASPDEMESVGRRALWRNGCDAGMVAP